MYTRVKRDRPKIKRDMYGVPIHDEDDMNTGESSEDTTGGRQLHIHCPSLPPSVSSYLPRNSADKFLSSAFGRESLSVDRDTVLARKLVTLVDKMSFGSEPKPVCWQRCFLLGEKLFCQMRNCFC